MVPTVSGADHEAKINQTDTGFSLQSSHGFEAKALRINTTGIGTDGRRYAYPTNDALQLTINISPVGQGWITLNGSTNIAGSDNPDTKSARALMSCFTSSYYNTVETRATVDIPGASSANGYGMRRFLEFPINEEATT